MAEDDPFRDVVEHPHGGLLFPAVLARKGSDGEVVEKKVRVRVPRPEEMIEARVKAVIWFNSKKVLDRKLDADTFEAMEQLCILAASIREWESLSQLHEAEELSTYDEVSLQAIQESINIYKRIVDPRVEELSDDEFWRSLLQMSRGKTIVPLGAMAGPAQYSFLLRTVCLAANSPEGLSYRRASESSTPEPSPSQS